MNKLQRKINETNFNLKKNLWKYMIAPVVILVTAIILLCTVGFNNGADFKGSSTFTIFTNSQKEIALANQYDVDKEDDLDAFLNEIEKVLDVDNLKIVSVQKTTMNVEDPMVMGGQALKITYISSKTDKETIKRQNDAIHQMLVEKFYENNESAVSSIDYLAPAFDYGWLVGILGATLSATVIALTYFAIRKRSITILALGILQLVMDAVLTLALMLVCRVPLNLTVAIILAISIIMSIANSFFFTCKADENISSGRYTNMSNDDMAQATMKESFVTKIVLYSALIVASLLFVALAENAVRFVALGALLALVATFFTSSFVLPTMWSCIYREKKAKKKIK